MNDSFSALHPALTFCYFAAVLLLTMLVLHPVFLALSLLGALGYCAVLRGWRSLGRTLGWLVPFLVLMAALNALFNHAGVTMLFYLPNGNPVTREALCYGAAAAAMFAAVILWFQCCNVVMTAEKYLYVFGSALPGVSLLLSMALRFVPKFSAHIRAVRAAQASLGCGTREGSAWQRLKNGARILSVTVSWALESGITAADSMKSRGYGAGRRTYFGNYRFTRRDGVLCAVFVLALAGVCALGLIYGPAAGLRACARASAAARCMCATTRRSASAATVRSARCAWRALRCCAFCRCCSMERRR